MSKDVKPSTLADGFNLVARDFDRAVRLARFDPLQAFLIGEARELSWVPGTRDGTMEPQSFAFNLSELARLLECSRSWLSCQCAELVALNVLAETGDGGFRINKDFRSWRRRIKTPAGETMADRFSDAQSSWCLEAKKLGRNSAPRRARRARQDRDTSPRRSSAPHSPDCAVRNTVPYNRSSGPHTQEQSTAQFGIIDTSGLSTQGPACDRLANPPSKPPYDPPVGTRVRETKKTNTDDVFQTSSRTGEDAAAVDAGLSTLASRLFPHDHDLGFALSAFASRYDPAWVDAATWCAFAGQVDRPRQYINACLGRWKARGGIPTDDAATAEGARSASPGGPRDKGARIDDALARIMAKQEVKP